MACENAGGAAIENDNLPSIARDDVAKCAIEYLSTILGLNRGGPLIGQFEDECWRRGADGLVRRTRELRYRYIGGLYDDSRPYKDLARAIRADNVFTQVIGKMVGTARTGWRSVDESQIVSSIVDSLLITSDGISLDEPRVQDRISALRTRYSAKFHDLTVLIPIPGMRLADSHALSREITLMQFDEDQIAALIECDLIRPSSIFPMVDSADCQGVRIAIASGVDIIEPGELPIIIDREHTFGDVMSSAISEVVEDILVTLQLSGLATSGVPGFLISDTAHGYRTWQTRPVRKSFAAQIEVTEEAVERARHLYIKLMSVAYKQVPRITLRRFSAAIDRQNLDDAILDYSIAVEALLLRDSSAERSELSYRLSLRGAYLLTQTGAERVVVLRFLKAVYASRSRIAHGASLGGSVRVVGEGSLDVAVFANRTMETTRLLIQKAIDEAGEKVQFGTSGYWEGLTLGVDRC